MKEVTLPGERIWLVRAFLVAPVFSFMAIIPWIRFGTNDDYGFLLITNGMFYGEPSNQVHFVGRVLGYLTQALTHLLPLSNWYAILMAISIIVAITTLIWFMFLQMRKTESIRVTDYLVATGFLLFGSQFFLRMQFTQTAIVCTGVGAVVWLFSETKSKKSILGLLLCAIGITWRIEAGLLTLILVIIGYCYLNQSKFSYFLFKKILFLVTFSFLIALLNYALWSKFSPILDRDAIQYITYDSIRGQLHGTRYLESSSSMLDALRLGFSSNDWNLFRSFYYANPSVYTLEKLRLLASNVISGNFNLSGLESFYDSVIIYFFPSIAYLILLCSISSPRNLRRIFFFFSIFLVSVLAIHLAIRMPARLFLPLIYIISYLCIVNEKPLVTPKILKTMPPRARVKLERNARVALKRDVAKKQLHLLPKISYLLIFALTLGNQSVRDVKLWEAISGHRLDSFRNLTSEKPIIAFSIIVF